MGTKPDQNEPTSKILFITDDGKEETLWAIPLGSNLYQLDNSPWLVYGVSWQDLIEAIAEDPEGFPVFRKVIKKSGNRTLRLVLAPPANKSPKSQGILNKLIKMGCSYEGANPKYIAINVPSSVNLRRICDFLTKTNNQWEYADPTFEEIFPKSSSS
jgi:hypothetical protein